MNLLIQQRTLPWLDPTTPRKPADAGEAWQTIRGDFERVGRWAVGAFGYLAAVAGTFLGVGGAGFLMSYSGPVRSLDVLGVVLACAFACAGHVLLFLMWRTGRKLLAGMMRWSVLNDELPSGWRGWAYARTANFEPKMFLRTASASITLLVALAGIALFIRDTGSGLSGMSWSCLVIALSSLACGCGLLGGTFQTVTMLAKRDPLSIRLRGLIGRSSGE